MTAAYQDKRITIIDEGITVGDKGFTMNLVNHSSVLTENRPLGSGKIAVNTLRNFFQGGYSKNIVVETTIYHLVLDIAGNTDTILSSKDEDYIRMLAGIINAFKGYTPHPEPSFDYEGEVLE